MDGGFRAYPRERRRLAAEVVRRFAHEATMRPLRAKAPEDSKDSRLDPEEKPTSGLTLRLNGYQLALIRRVAAAQNRSLQQTIKRVLIPALEALDGAAGQGGDADVSGDDDYASRPHPGESKRRPPQRAGTTAKGPRPGGTSRVRSSAD